jgi:phage recombination protein Bet
MGTDLVTTQKASLIGKFATRYSIEPAKLKSILKATAFKVKDGVVSDEQMAALLVVADQYNLNPFTKEIFAFPDKQNGIVPVVGADGWNRIANEHPQYDGEELIIPPRSEWVQMDDDAKLAPPHMTIRIFRKDRKHPTEHTEYLDECYRPAFEGKSRNGGGTYKVAGPWQSHTKRMLEHKTRIQGRRIAFGFAGIYDEDEAERIVAANELVIDSTAVEEPVDRPIGEDGWRMLVGLAADVGFSGDDVLANAAALGYEGPGEGLPTSIAQRLVDGLREAAPADDVVLDPDDDPDDPEPWNEGAGEPQDAETAAEPSEPLFAPETPPASQDEGKAAKPRSVTELAQKVAEKADAKRKAKPPAPGMVTMLDNLAEKVIEAVGPSALEAILFEAAGVKSVDEVTAEYATATKKQLEAALERIAAAKGEA